jgi:hypothetical protein
VQLSFPNATHDCKQVRLYTPSLTRVSVHECPRLTVLDVYAPQLERLDITECVNMQEAELSAFARNCHSNILAYVNVELFGLSPDQVATHAHSCTHTHTHARARARTELYSPTILPTSPSPRPRRLAPCLEGR